MVEHRDLQMSEAALERVADEQLVAWLNAILELERAGTRVLTALMAGSSAPGANALLAQVQRDQARNCALLTRMVRRLGGTPSMAVGAFRDHVLAVPTLEDRLALLNRGQAWAARRLGQLLPQVADAGLAAELADIRDTHRANIAACDVLLDGLSEISAGE